MLRILAVLSVLLSVSLCAVPPAETGDADGAFFAMDPTIGSAIHTAAIRAAPADHSEDADGSPRMNLPKDASSSSSSSSLSASSSYGGDVDEQDESVETMALLDMGDAEGEDASVSVEEEDAQDAVDAAIDEDDAADDDDGNGMFGDDGAEEKEEDDKEGKDDQDEEIPVTANDAETLEGDGDPGDAADAGEVLADDASSRRSEDLALMEKLGTKDLGSGAAGGALVSKLLGTTTVMRHGSGHFSTVFSRSKSRSWRALHSVLLSNGTAVDKAIEAVAAAARGQAAKFSAKGFTLSNSTHGNGTVSMSFNATALRGNSNATEDDVSLSAPPLRHLLPLLRFFDGHSKDHISNTDPYEFSNRAGPYQFQGIIAFVYGRRVIRESTGHADADLVPFYRLWDTVRKDHYFSLTPAVNGTHVVPQGVAGYIYTSGAYPGLVPLNEYFCKENGDHLYSVSGTDDIMINKKAYKYVKTFGYVQPLDAIAKRKAEIAAEGKQEKPEDDAAEVKKEDAEDKKEKEAPKQPESLREKKESKWHPGQPLFVDNLDWSK